MKPTDINQYKRIKMTNPDYIYVDSEDVVWYKYTCSYDDMNGINMIFEIWAKSDEDANERLQYLKGNAKVDGGLIDYEGG